MGALISIQPPLRVGEDLYAVAYRTTSDFRVDSPFFFTLLEGPFLEDREIRELLVTKNGEKVTDPNPEYVQYGGNVEALPVPTESSDPGEAADEAAGDAAGNAAGDVGVGEVAPCSVAAAGGLEGMQTAGKLGCAQAAAGITWAAYTPFEGGFILWRRDTQQIYGFFNDGTWKVVSDRWDGSSPTPSRGSPPPGRLEPVRGAGSVWGTDDDFFNHLGWAAGEQTGFCAEVQTFADGFALRSSTTPRCDADNVNPVPSADFLSLAAADDGTWTR